MAQALSQEPLLPTPQIECPFYFGDPRSTKEDNIDVSNQPYTSKSSGPPMVHGSLRAAVSLCTLKNEITAHNNNVAMEVGHPDDMAQRAELYRQLCSFAVSLPDSLKHGRNLTPQTFQLW